MKYVLLFCGTTEDQAAFDALSQEDLRERYAGAVGRGARQCDHGLQARAAQLRAAELTANTAEQALLHRRIELLQADLEQPRGAR